MLHRGHSLKTLTYEKNIGLSYVGITPTRERLLGSIALEVAPTRCTLLEFSM
jgi:hypothetical protein